jgi:hypothetical protein
MGHTCGGRAANAPLLAVITTRRHRLDDECDSEPTIGGWMPRSSAKADVRAVFTGPAAPSHTGLMTRRPQSRRHHRDAGRYRWGPTVVIRGDVATELRRLKQQTRRRPTSVRGRRRPGAAHASGIQGSTATVWSHSGMHTKADHSPTVLPSFRAQKVPGHHGDGSQDIAADNPVSEPGRCSVTSPASASEPSRVPPR